MEKNHLLAEYQALQSRLQASLTEDDVAKVQRMHPEMVPQGSFAAAGYPTKVKTCVGNCQMVLVATC